MYNNDIDIQDQELRDQINHIEDLQRTATGISIGILAGPAGERLVRCNKETEDYQNILKKFAVASFDMAQALHDEGQKRIELVSKTEE